MTIKELHIRNIVSIERCDIDFENGLCDAISGEPASLFLISGDTGAGKTAILDSISLALYMKTPRLDGVSNVTNNDYVNNEGEIIKVASIEQYTRLGISENDDCYCEVVFTGNDNRDYHARLTLGMQRDRTKRTLKHRKPKWEVKVDEEDWQHGIKEVKGIILNAVGLTFEQFGRMSMLAQGQFATFLTGNKQERESILEQLTNTERFSLYGIAIKNLFTKAKDTCALIQKEHDTEKTHILNEEEKVMLEQQQKSFDEQLKTIDKQLSKCETRIKLAMNIGQCQKDIEETTLQIRQIEQTIAQEGYQNDMALVQGWDSTTTQRQLLAKQKEHRLKIKQAVEDASKLKITYLQLKADHAKRLEDIKELSDDIKVRQQWLTEQKYCEELYANAAVVIQQMEQYESAKSNEHLFDEKVKSEKEKTATLEENARLAAQKAEKAAMCVEEKQKEIDEMTRQREAMMPEKINNELHVANKILNKLTKLQDKLSQLTEREKEYRLLAHDIEEKESQLAILAEQVGKAQEAFVKAKERDEQATNRLHTMKTSMEDYLSTLRRRMEREQTETCPLCGQHIDHLHVDDEFKSVLTPLEEEKKESESQLSKATTEKEQATEKHTHAAAVLSTKRQQYQSLEQKIQELTCQATNEADLISINTSRPMAPQVAETIEIVKEDVENFKEKQQKAEELQKLINNRLEEKNTLSRKAVSADNDKKKADKACDDNRQEIIRLEERLKDFSAQAQELHRKITAALSVLTSTWDVQIEESKNSLKTSAAEYMQRKEKLLDDGQTLKTWEQTERVIAGTHEKIADLHHNWNIDMPPAPVKTSNIYEAWAHLEAQVLANRKTIDENTTAEEECKNTLEKYYEETGTTEAMLQSLVEKERELNEARSRINATQEKLASRRDAQTAAQRQMDENIKMFISITPESDDIAAHVSETILVLNNEKDQLTVMRDDLMTQRGSIKNKLEENNRNIARFKILEEKFRQAKDNLGRWTTMNKYFGGTRFRTLVQTYILLPLLNNANIYLTHITDRYRLTCSEENEQLAILVLDRYNKDQVRSITVLSGGERFMVSLALSLALSSLNRPGMSAGILFIDEGFGTLDEKSLHAVMSTLERLQEIAGQDIRRVGIISHREELSERIPVQIKVTRHGEGRSFVEIKGTRTSNQ